MMVTAAFNELNRLKNNNKIRINKCVKIEQILWNSLEMILFRCLLRFYQSRIQVNSRLLFLQKSSYCIKYRNRFCGNEQFPHSLRSKRFQKISTRGN